MIQSRLVGGLNSEVSSIVGRPGRVVSLEDVRRLRSEGASIRQIAEKLGVGYGKVRLTLARASELKTPMQRTPHAH